MPTLTPIPTLHGAVTLRAFTEADAPLLAELCQDPDVVRFTGVPEGYTLADAHARIQRVREEAEAGSALRLAIADAGTDTLLGAIDLFFPSADQGVGEIGYMLAPWARGRGVMTVALRLLAEHALRVLCLERVQVLCETANPGSGLVAQRAGFTYEGTLRAFRSKKGRREDRLVYSLLPGELTGVRFYG